MAAGDVQGVLDRLAPDVVCTSDGGPHRRAARRPVVTAPRVARLLVNLGRRYRGRMEVTPVSVNGDAGYVVEVDGLVDQVLSCSVADGRVVAIRIMRNPDKLRRVGAPVRLALTGRRGRPSDPRIAPGTHIRRRIRGPAPAAAATTCAPPSPSGGPAGGVGPPAGRRAAAQGRWSPDRRGHDALETILAQNEVRDPDLLALAPRPAWPRPPGTTTGGPPPSWPPTSAPGPDSGLEVQLCGDAHVLNFGLWATPERNLAFDLRDFDETLPGPFEWDVHRLAASLVVAARAGGIRQAGPAAPSRRRWGLPRPHAALRRRCPSSTSGTTACTSTACSATSSPPTAGWCRSTSTPSKRKRTHRGAYAKLTEMAHGRPRITEDPPVRSTIDDDEQADLVDELLAGYRRRSRRTGATSSTGSPRPTWSARWWASGSVGMRVYLVLFEGRSGVDPLFLQCKQAGPSVYEAHPGPSAHANHGAAGGHRQAPGPDRHRHLRGVELASAATTTTCGSSAT